jgi:O-antigen ligase
MRALLFISLFALCAGRALFAPQFGVYGYISDYIIGPATQWYAVPLRRFGIRYSFTLAFMTLSGLIFYWSKLRQGKKTLQNQEILMLIFLGLIWFSSFLGPETVNPSAKVDSPAIKFTKITFFCLMMTHIITERRKLNGLIWVIIVATLILGLQAYYAPRSSYVKGRLEGCGGPDFADSNRFGGVMAGMLFIIGTQLLRSGWKGKCVCLVSGAFAANAVMLTQCRGALVGIANGLFTASLFAPKKYRIKIIIGIIIVCFGLFFVAGDQVLKRASTITSSEEERDSSAGSRLEIWEGGIKMMLDYPLFGVGPGNFYQFIEIYQPLHPGRDAHNTFVRTGGDLGVTGLILYVIILGNAFLKLLKFVRKSHDSNPEITKEYSWISFGFLTCITTIITYGMTGSLTYLELLWWMYMIPVCIQRSFENEMADLKALEGATKNHE